MNAIAVGSVAPARRQVRRLERKALSNGGRFASAARWGSTRIGGHGMIGSGAVDSGLAGDGCVERYERVDGIRTFSRSLGSGPDVLLVHGAGVSSEYWRPAQVCLACCGFRVHALDLPGFGRSGDPPWPPRFSRLAEHVLRWTERHLTGRFDLVGQSVGCDLSVLAAVARPERIRRLVLAAPSGLPVLHSITVQLLQALRDGFREPLCLYPAILPAYFRCGPLRFFRILAEQKDPRATAALEAIRQPTLVLRGEADTVVTAERVAEVARRIRHSVTDAIPGAHGAHYTHAPAFTRAVACFLSQPDGSAASRESQTAPCFCGPSLPACPPSGRR